MAYDKVVDSSVLEAGLTTVADAIRAKGGTSAPLEFPQGMADAVAAIEGGGDDYAISILNRSLVSLVSDQIIQITSKALAECPIKTLDVPNCTLIGNTALQNTAELSRVNCSSVEELRFGAFRNCGLAEIALPSLRVIEMWALGGSKNLKRIDLGRSDITLSRIFPQSVFQDTPVDALVLRYKQVAEASNANLLANTPIASGAGYIYVPKTLVEQYKVATNWVTYANQFRAIEDYPEITGG